jgi:dihydroflavonol-4-reductase
MMKVFVTGATGFVGSHVAEQLEAMGADVRVLVRKTSRSENLEILKAERVVGDLRDFESLKKGMSGCEFVFHVAADYRLWARDPQEMYASNVEGTKSIIRAAQETGVRRVVYTSSVATMGFTTPSHAKAARAGDPGSNGNDPNVVDESTPVDLSMMIGHYKKSKFLAEQAAFEMAKAGADVVIVNPSTPIGERDIKPTPTGQIVVDFLKKKFPAYVDTGLNLVDVRECARGHIQAMERGRSGERYILGGENLTMRALLALIAEVAGQAPPRLRLPIGPLMPLATVSELVGRLTGREPMLTRDALRMARKRMWYSSARAIAELGYAPRPGRVAVEDAVSWFRAHP